MVDSAGLYADGEGLTGTHLALGWNGRVRYIVPQAARAQQTCWHTFIPGKLGLPLKAMARMPRLFGAIRCVETASMEAIRKSIGADAGLSCCRTGAPGPWSKDTLLFLSGDRFQPAYFVKAGRGAKVNSLLRNEAHWLQRLYAEGSLAEQIPGLIAHCPGEHFSFIVERPLSGELDFHLRGQHVDFLRKLQKILPQTTRYEESRLCETIASRALEMKDNLSDAWLNRLQRAMDRIEAQFSGSALIFTAAHNDFTPWNIRLKGGRAYAFDWEYAAEQCLPLFDPLHFVLLPLALRRSATATLVRGMNELIQACQGWFGIDICRNAQAQALAYLLNISTLYLQSIHGMKTEDPVLDSYARLIDHLCAPGR